MRFYFKGTSPHFDSLTTENQLFCAVLSRSERTSETCLDFLLRSYQSEPVSRRTLMDFGRAHLFWHVGGLKGAKLRFDWFVSYEADVLTLLDRTKEPFLQLAACGMIAQVGHGIASRPDVVSALKRVMHTSVVTYFGSFSSLRQCGLLGAEYKPEHFLAALVAVSRNEQDRVRPLVRDDVVEVWKEVSATWLASKPRRKLLLQCLLKWEDSTLACSGYSHRAVSNLIHDIGCSLGASEEEKAGEEEEAGDDTYQYDPHLRRSRRDSDADSDPGVVMRFQFDAYDDTGASKQLGKAAIAALKNKETQASLVPIMRQHAGFAATLCDLLLGKFVRPTGENYKLKTLAMAAFVFGSIGRYNYRMDGLLRKISAAWTVFSNFRMDHPQFVTRDEWDQLTGALMAKLPTVDTVTAGPDCWGEPTRVLVPCGF